MKERLKTLYTILYVMSVWYTDEPIKIAIFILTQQTDYHGEALRRIHFIFHHLNSSFQLQTQTRQHFFIVFYEYTCHEKLLSLSDSNHCLSLKGKILFGYFQLI